MQFSKNKICKICGRTPKIAVRRSHSMRASKRIQYLNLQITTYKNKKVYACNKCRRTQLKIRKK